MCNNLSIKMPYNNSYTAIGNILFPVFCLYDQKYIRLASRISISFGQ